MEDCVRKNIAGQDETEGSLDEVSEVDDGGNEEVEVPDETAGETENCYRSRSGMIWKSRHPPSSKTKQINIVRESPGPTPATIVA